jgi:hypothetical protein
MMRPRCSTLAAGFGFSGCEDCASGPLGEQTAISNSEPSVIVLHDILCMGVDYIARFEWKIVRLKGWRFNGMVRLKPAAIHPTSQDTPDQL